MTCFEKVLTNETFFQCLIHIVLDKHGLTILKKWLTSFAFNNKDQQK